MAVHLFLGALSAAAFHSAQLAERMPMTRLHKSIVMDEVPWKGIPEDEQMAAEKARQEARERMRALMGDSERLQRGEGAAFGFGSTEADEFEDKVEIDPISGKVMRGVDQQGDAFGGRRQGWGRKIEAIDPNPPPLANTLRSPGEVPVANVEPEKPLLRYEDALAAAKKQAQDFEAAQLQEDALLEALKGSCDWDTV